MAAFKKKGISSDELAVVYAALILADDDIPITEDKINTILSAAEVRVESIWPALFSKALQTVNVRQLITSVGSSSADSAPVADAAPAAPPPVVESKAPEPEEEEDSDDDMGLSLFD